MNKFRLFMYLLLQVQFINISAVKVKIGNLYYNLSGTTASVVQHTDGWGNAYGELFYEIPESVTYAGKKYTVTSIDENAFSSADGVKNASKVEQIVIPKTVKKIGSHAFYRCAKLRNVELCDGLEEIDSYAFGRCTSLDDIIIPSTVVRFGSFVFSGCDILRSIIYRPSTPPINWVACPLTIVPDTKLYENPPYTLSFAEIYGFLEFESSEFDYNGTSPTVGVIANNFRSLYNSNYKCTYELPTLNSDAGEYEIKIPVSYKITWNSRYDFSVDVTYRYKINKKTLTAKAVDATRIYGEPDPKFEIVYDGFIQGDNKSCITEEPFATTETDMESDVGDYPISLSGGSATNYDFAYIQGILTIDKANLMIRVNDVTKIYGEENPNFTITYNGLISKDKQIDSLTPIVFTTTATKQSSVGQYAVSASGASFKNYDVVDYKDGTLSISKAALVIKANDASRLYFDDDPKFTFTCSGFVNGDDENSLSKLPTFRTDATTNSSVGVYNIFPSSASSANYVISYEPGILTINKRTLNAKAVDASREYGDTNPAFKIQYDGFVNNETENDLISVPVTSCSATCYSTIGNYDINISGGSATNYELSHIKGVLSIIKAPLHIYVNDCSKVYGQHNPAFTCRYNGLKNDESFPTWNIEPSYITEANFGSDVGTYGISLLNGNAKNYDITIHDGLLTINKAELIIKASDKSRLYYEDNPTFSFTCSGFKNSDNEAVFTKAPSFECPAIISSKVGEYQISISGADCKNYTPIYENGVLVVNKRTLTVRPNDFTRKYAEDNPEFTYIINGFVNDEDISVLLQKPVAYTNANSFSDVGIYSIFVKDAISDNYAFDYQQGVLTIEKANQVISWEQEFKGINVGDQVELLATSSSGLDIDYLFDTDIVSMYESESKFYLDCLAAGTFTIRASQSGNKNYNAAVRVAKKIFIEDPSSVSGSEAESYTKPIYYDLSGKKIYSPPKGRFVIRIDKGKVQKIMVK